MSQSYYKLANDTLWANAGYMIAWDQFKVPWSVPAEPAPNPASINALVLNETGSAFEISGWDFSLMIGKVSGVLESYIVNGHEMIVSPLVPNFWRVPTDNDEDFNMSSVQGVLKNAGQNRTVSSITASQPQAGLIQVDVGFAIPAGSTTLDVSYTIYGDGRVKIQNDVYPAADH